MLKEMLQEIKISLLVLLVFTVITGLIYPFIVTLIAQYLYPWQANGSLIEQDNQIIGSALIGQSFTDPDYFWGRPSATTPYPYNAASSSGSNLGPLNPDFLNAVKDRVAALKKIDGENTVAIPVDLVTASGSGLDPEISPLAAMYQVPRIARQRHLPEKEIQQLIEEQIQARKWALLGEPRVNVLQLNIALNHLRTKHARSTPKS